MNEWKHLTQRVRTATLALGLLTAVYLSPVASAAMSTPIGHEARTVSVNDAAHLHPSHFNGSTLLEEGVATGTLPGAVRAKLVIGTTTVRVSFTIYVRGGSIPGQAVAKLNPGKGEYASFAGTLTVNHGSGHYAHASGSGRVSGTIRRNEDAAVVQVVGQLHT
jgi:hypothetical protein